MSLKKQAVLGVKWNFLQQFSVQVINFGVQIILARMLMPEMFGLIAMIIVFISIGQTLMDSGMTSSLIRTKNPDQTDYSTVFVTNLLMSSVIYAITFLIAPYIAVFYNQEVLTNIIRVLALSFVIRAFVAVHIAKLDKEMNFKLQMKLQVPSVIISGTVGITMAYMGYGVWSLVWLNLAQAIAFAVQSWVIIPWKPTLVFNKERFVYHFKFGYKLTLSGLIDTIYNDLYRIIIGKFYSPAQVGYFNQAETMRLFPVQQISSVMGKVTYPFFSNISNDVSLKKAYRITMKLITFAVLPVMLSLILVAEEGFRFVFGEKWLPAVPYFQVLALASIIRPISAYNLNILKVKGRSDLFLLVEIIKKIVGVIFLVAMLKHGVTGLVIGLLAYSYVSYLVNTIVSGRLITYSLFSQIIDVALYIVVGALVFVLLYLLKVSAFINLPDLASCIVYPLLFFVAYLVTVLGIDTELRKTLIRLRK